MKVEQRGQGESVRCEDRENYAGSAKVQRCIDIHTYTHKFRHTIKQLRKFTRACLLQEPFHDLRLLVGFTASGTAGGGRHDADNAGGDGAGGIVPVCLCMFVLNYV